mgnify:FL=1|jgi:type I restriction enzyme, S subunit
MKNISENVEGWKILPEKWNFDRMKDISEINAVSLGRQTLDDHEFRYLEISNVNYQGIISEDAIERINFGDAPSRARRKIKFGDVAISSVRPNLQAIAHVNTKFEGELICSTGFNVVTTRSKLSGRFLYYFVLSEGNRQFFESVAKGVGYPAIDDKDFEKTMIPLPPIPEQKRIAAYLDASCAALDRAVETKQKQLETLDALRKSIIQNAVTQGLDTNVKMKDSGVDWLGKVPEHWKLRKFKRIASLHYGDSLSVDSRKNGTVKVFGSNGVVGNHCVANHLSPCIIVGRKGSQGKITFSLDAPFVIDTAYGIDSSQCNNNLRWVFYALSSSPIDEKMRDSPVPGLARRDAYSIGLALPPLEEQKQISAFLDKKMNELRELSDNLSKQITTLTQYRKSLIHECVTGERRISV